MSELEDQLAACTATLRQAKADLAEARAEARLVDRRLERLEALADEVEGLTGRLEMAAGIPAPRPVLRLVAGDGA